MPAIDPIQDLERRVSALEAAQNDTTQTLRWVVAKLGKMSATLDEHTLQLERLDVRMDRLEQKVDALPSAIADTMREVLKERGQ
jgi:uncharacterized coiled-coil protein SlyX